MKKGFFEFLKNDDFGKSRLNATKFLLHNKVEEKLWI